MKRYLIIFAFIFLSASQLQAQVNREVEVTKAYVPTVQRPEKPLLQATIADTAYINPNVDYSITPLAINTQLQTKAINPATVTYWEFNRPSTAQLKVGGGYPWNSLLQGYASTHNASVGYLSANIDHVGDFSKLESSDGARLNATEVLNRIKLDGGLYLGERTLSASAAYSNDIYHNYAFEQTNSTFINYKRVGGALSFGDSFVDLSKFNYSISGKFSHFADGHSATNNSWMIAADFGKEYSVGEILAGVDFGQISSNELYANQTIAAYIYLQKQIADWQFNIGFDYHFDKSDGVESDTPNSYFMPRLALYQRSSHAISPFIEVTGSMVNNSFEQLSAQNPYIGSGVSAASSAEYSALGGVAGKNNSSTLSYRIYGGYKISTNNCYWALMIDDDADGAIASSYFDLDLSSLNTASANLNLDFSPRSNLSLLLDAHYYFYSGEQSGLYLNSLPDYKGSIAAEYTLRKLLIGVKGQLTGARSYSVVTLQNGATFEEDIPAVFDLSAYAQWSLRDDLSIFLEGDNLCNTKLYPWPMYRGFGIRFTGGVKMKF